MTKTVLIAICFFISLVATKSAQTNSPLKIGVYRSVGSLGIIDTLKEDQSFTVQQIDKLGMKTLRNFDVIVFGSLRGGITFKKWEHDLLTFVKCGGGVVLHHDATGYRRWEKALFPNILKGFNKIESKTVRLVNKEHPVAQELPGEFKHGYYDHIQIKPGPEGKVIAHDEQKQPIVVIGIVEKGRVAGNGMVTGFSSPKEGKQGEAKAEGAERQLLLNLICWVGENRISNLSEKEFDKRVNELTLKETADVAAEMGEPSESESKNIGNISPGMIYEHGNINPPAALIKNQCRFFLFDGGNKLSIGYEGKRTLIRSPEEIKAIMTRLKWVGVTDIIMQTGGPVTLKYVGYLKAMVEGAGKTGLNLWAFWHSQDRSFKGKETYMVKDNEGKPIQYIDITSPILMKRCGEALDEIVKLNTNNRIKGVFLDEFWHPFVPDKLEDNIPQFVEFCQKRYNSKPPENIGELFSKGLKWHEPKNVWWRRYIIWKNTLIIDYVKKLTEMAHTRGLKIINQPYFTPGNRKGWFLGHGDCRGLAQLGDYLWTYEPRYSDLFDNYPHDKTIYGVHANYNSGYNCISLLQGNHGSYFIFQSLWLPLALGVNPREIDVFTKILLNNRQWYGAQNLTDVGILTNGIGIELTQMETRKFFETYNTNLKKTLLTSQSVMLLLTRDTQFYKRYKLLFAPPLSVSFLPGETIKGLKKYLNNGGNIVSLNADFSSSRDDHTDKIDLTTEFTGIKYKVLGKEKSFEWITLAGTKQKINVKTSILRIPETLKNEVETVAFFGDSDKPAITRFPYGKGKVLAFHFDVVKAMNEKQEDITDFFLGQSKKLTSPPISVDGKLSIFKTLKKNNWIIITLLGQEINNIFNRSYPAKGTLHVDLEKLGLRGKIFNVYSLARNRKILPPPHDLLKKTINPWDPEQLKKGINIFIPKDSEEGLEPPMDIDDKYYLNVTLKYWKQRKVSRAYEHEIIAIAPAGELPPDIITEE